MLYEATTGCDACLSGYVNEDHADAQWSCNSPLSSLNTQLLPTKHTLKHAQRSPEPDRRCRKNPSTSRRPNLQYCRQELHDHYPNPNPRVTTSGNPLGSGLRSSSLLQDPRALQRYVFPSRTSSVGRKWPSTSGLDSWCLCSRPTPRGIRVDIMPPTKLPRLERSSDAAATFDLVVKEKTPKVTLIIDTSSGL